MSDMRFATLDDWLNWQETLHPRTIELGLERVRAVLRRLRPEPPPISSSRSAAPTARVPASRCWRRSCAPPAIGSALIPRRTCCATTSASGSNGAEADDAAICRAFARIDAARGDHSLTYFEFGTLAALELFRDAG
jgi:dihydrofolate synthase/folylpolyglutamate synthase